MSLPKQLLESKLITNEQWKEYQELKEEVNDLRRILNMQHKREYYSKFFKDFQKEKGKNVYPDFDEIYKRYDKQKEEIKRLEVENRELSEGYNEEFKENARLNNIINETEKELKNRIKNVPDTMVEVYEDESILNKLQELKGSDK